MPEGTAWKNQPNYLRNFFDLSCTAHGKAASPWITNIQLFVFHTNPLFIHLFQGVALNPLLQSPQTQPSRGSLAATLLYPFHAELRGGVLFESC